VDGGSLNSECGLVERILSRAVYHLHRRMISTALGGFFLAQSAGCIREMRILGSHPAVRSQLAKLAVLAGKVVEFETFGCSESQKEKKI
jgi:hypothetical protein